MPGSRPAARPRQNEAVKNTLSVAEAKSFYDRFGAKQDSQAFYENAALDDLVSHAALESARHVFEFGCGTGRFAERILSTILPPEATWEGADVSTTMMHIAQSRLARFGERAVVRQIDGTNPFAELRGRPDRIVATYVLDLLPREAIEAFAAGALNVLEPGGRICIASLTFGRSAASRLFIAAWRGMFRLSPRIVGGCRPIELLPFFSPAAWEVTHHRIVSSFFVPSEILVASKR